jgi:peptidoglycan/LPS O-acetylase OafA/YrhL
MGVLLAHCATAGLVPPVFNFGQMPVGLFFILSGFLMSRLYLGESFKENAYSFVRSRVGRIAPLYLLVVALSVALASTPIWTFPVHSSQKLANHLLFLKGDYTLWTIAVEVQFYALFLVLWLAHGRGKLARVLVVTVTLQVLAAATLYARSVPDEKLPFWLHFFLFGMLLSLYHTRAMRPANLVVASRVTHALGWGAICLMLLAIPGVRAAVGLPVLANWADPLTVAAPALLFIATLRRLPPLRLFEHAIARELGKISYGIYLLHFPVLMTLKDLPLPGYLTTCLVAAITLLGATLSFHRFELPAARLIGRWPRQQRAT